MTAPSPQRVRYRGLLRNREFAALIFAQIVSEVGDHFARVAVAGLVLHRTQSAFYAAAVFVAGYVPGILGSAVFSGLADRLPRKTVLLGCDVGRVALVTALALAATDTVPLWVLFALLLAVELFGAPFDAARLATMPDVLPDPDEYLAGAGLSRVLFQANQVVGLATAGIVVFSGGARVAFVVDAATFVVSFWVLLVGLRARPAAAGSPSWSLLSDLREGARLIFTDPIRRTFVLLAWGAAMFLVAPEGVALAYAAEHDVPDLGGVLMAAIPAGAVLGSAYVSRLRPEAAVRVVRPLLLLGCVPLLLTGLDLPVHPTIVLWLVAGACQAFIVPVMVTVNLVSPASHRGRVNGLAAAGFNLAVALAFLGAGFVADVSSPSLAVAASGLSGLAVLLAAHLAWPERELRAALGDPPPRRRSRPDMDPSPSRR